MVKLVIGLTGLIGSGKDEVANYLVEHYGFHSISTGDLVRAELKKLEKEINRENQQWLGAMKKKGQQDYWPSQVIKKIIDENWSYAIFNGLRFKIDYTASKKEFGDKFIVARICANKKIRLERLIERNRPGDPKNLDDLNKQEEGEFRNFDLKYIFRKRDYCITNNDGLESLYKKIDAFMTAYHVKRIR